PDEELDERGLAGAGWPDKRDGFAAAGCERNVADGRGGGRLVLEGHPLEGERAEIPERDRTRRARLARHAQDVLKDVQRRFRLSVDVDDVSELLEGSKDKERVDEQGEELANGDG